MEAFVFLIFLGIGIFALLKAQSLGNRSKKREEILKEVGVAEGKGYEHFEGDSGIVVNSETGTLTLLAAGFHKTYPFADVRDWESRHEQAGRSIGVGIQAGLAAAASNMEARNRAAKNSGLFVSVRDIDHPQWRVDMADQKMQARWMEILRQQINRD